MLTRLLETAANAADAAQTGSTTFDMTQLTNLLDWVMIVLLPAVALYLFYTVFRLRRDRVLFDNKLLYPGGCTKDDCIDPDGFIDYILPRLIIIGAAFLLCGAFTALVVFIPAMARAYSFSSRFLPFRYETISRQTPITSLPSMPGAVVAMR